METRETMRERVLEEKAETLIAIAAAAAANCIPCFEHLYEMAVASGITMTEIKRASDIAAKVKSGANKAIFSVIDELTGSNEPDGSVCIKTSDGSCCC